MEQELQIRALESALEYAMKQVHLFRHNKQSVAEIQKVIRRVNEIKNSRDHFREGDLVTILNDHNALRKDDLVSYVCCPEELGGLENIKLRTIIL